MNKCTLYTVDNRTFVIDEKFTEEAEKHYNNKVSSELHRLADIILDEKYGTVLKNKYGRTFKDNWRKSNKSVDEVEYAKE